MTKAEARALFVSNRKSYPEKLAKRIESVKNLRNGAIGLTILLVFWMATSLIQMGAAGLSVFLRAWPIYLIIALDIALFVYVRRSFMTIARGIVNDVEESHPTDRESIETHYGRRGMKDAFGPWIGFTMPSVIRLFLWISPISIVTKAERERRAADRRETEKRSKVPQTETVRQMLARVDSNESKRKQAESSQKRRK